MTHTGNLELERKETIWSRLKFRIMLGLFFCEMQTKKWKRSNKFA